MSQIKMNETQRSLQATLTEIIEAGKEFKEGEIHENYFKAHLERSLKFLINSTITDCRNQLAEIQSELLKSI